MPPPELRRVFSRKRKRKSTSSSTNYHNQQQLLAAMSIRTRERYKCDRMGELVGWTKRKALNVQGRGGRKETEVDRGVIRTLERLIVVCVVMLPLLATMTAAAAVAQAQPEEGNLSIEGAKAAEAKQMAQVKFPHRDRAALLAEANNKLVASASAAAVQANDAGTAEQPLKEAGGPTRLDRTELKVGRLARWKRAAQSAELMRVVAVSGQWIELQCPLVSELSQPASSSTSTSTSSSSSSSSSSSASSSSGNSRSSLQLYSIQWRKNGVRLDQLNPRYKINSANGSLVIANSQPKVDEANYECWLVHNQEGKGQQEADEAEPIKSHRLELRLLVPPKVAPFEFASDAQVGMKLVLTCSILEGQQPISFVWLKDNKIIVGDEQQHQPMVSATSQANSLGQLHQQQLADKYALSPMPYSLARSAYKAEYRLLGPSSSMAANDSSSGAGQVNEVQQLLPLLSDTNIRVRQSDDYSILSIDKLELKHSGRYTCSVQNEAARTSHSSQLIINAPPTLTVAPKEADLVSGQSVVIECAASGQPRPTISWLRARETLAESNSKQWDYVPVYDNLRYTILANGSLAIGNMTQREQGFYLCSAKNPFGTEMSKLAKISVHEPAKFSSKYKTVEVRVEESTSLLCTATGELPVTIEWRNKEENLIQANDKRFIVEHQPQDLNQPDELASNTTTVSRLIVTKSQRSDSGHYSCHAKNKYGTDKMVTNLLVQDVPDKVTDLKVTNTTSSSIFLRWQVAFSGNSPITSYLVQYLPDDPLDDLLISMGSTTGSNQQLQSRLGDKTSASSSSTSASPLRVALEALNLAGSSVDSVEKAIDRTLIELTVEQSATHLAVKDLSPFCVYRLRLAAINKIGLGEFSDWIRAKTEEAPPGASTSKMSAAATGPNSIKVTWSPPDRRAWNGQLIGFNIGFRPIDSTFELNKTIEWSPPSLQSMVLDSRKPHPTGIGLISNSATASGGGQGKTMTAEPATTTTTNNNHEQAGPLDNNKSGSARVANSTTTSSEGGGGGGSLRQHLRQLLALQQQELVAHLTNLQRSTTYLLWIQAINSRGQGPQSHAISVKTLDDVPPSAPAIKIQATSFSSITIAWSMLSNFVSSANQYSLFYRKVPAIHHHNQVTQSSAPGMSRQSMLSNNNNNNNASSSFSGDLEDSQPLGGYLSFNQNQNHNQIPNHQLNEAIDGPNQPFIERSITSQQLMASGHLNILTGADYEPHNQLADIPKFLSHQQQQQQQQGQQHYQQFAYTLDQLDCGSLYELYMSTRNSVGKSEPSAIVTARTLGEPPMAPINKNNFFSKIGVNEVALNLAAWSTGGCPIAHMTVRYKQSPMPVASASVQNPAGNQQPTGGNSSSQSTSPPISMSVSWPITTSVPVSLLNALNHNNLPPQRSAPHYTPSSSLSSDHLHALKLNESPVYYLRNLMPSNCYELEVIAYNTAGHTAAQYEFVTSNLNGTRAGYSRREGVYRVELGGPQEQLLAPDGSARGGSIEQQMSYNNNRHNQAQPGGGQQVLPLLLMALCLVCLLVSSAFCYNRLLGSWKQQRRRRDSNDTSARGGQGPANSSPGSIGGKSSMWAVGDTTSRYGALPVSRNLHQVGGASGEPSNGADSPTTTLHYCMRGGGGGGEPQQATLSATLNPNKSMAQTSSSSFGQSVSMKDFNLANTAGRSKMPSGTATLSYKNYRTATMRHPDYKTTTLRARLFSEQPNNNGLINGGPGQTFLGHQEAPGGQICQDSCKQRAANYVDLSNRQNGTAATAQISVESANQQQVASSSPSDLYSTHQFNYTQDGQQLQQETSWTNHYHTHCLQEHQNNNNGTAYAVPATASNYANEQQLDNNYGPRVDQSQIHLDSDHSNNQTNIDACIQQLIGQQYHQQQQQQPYSMVMNFKPDRCLYDTAKAVDNQIRAQPINSIKQQTVTCAGPFLDSSSSSSGIDVGANLECASTTTGGTSNSTHTSNELYHRNNQQQQQLQHCHDPTHFNSTNQNSSEFNATEQYNTLQSILQQFNEST